MVPKPIGEALTGNVRIDKLMKIGMFKQALRLRKSHGNQTSIASFLPDYILEINIVPHWRTGT